jgi:hypothetical protein
MGPPSDIQVRIRKHLLPKQFSEYPVGKEFVVC